MKEGFDVCEEDVVNIVKAAANKLTKAGAIVEEMSIPMHADGESTVLQIRMPVYKTIPSLFLNQTYFVGTQKNGLNETILLSSQNCLISK